MSLNVIVTEEAYETLEITLDFVREKWGQKTSDKLDAEIRRKLKLIALHPYMYKASSIKTELRKCTVSKQTSFFYEIMKEHILVVYFWDNRQQPIME